MEKTGRTGSVTKTSRRHSRHQNGEKPMELSSMPNYATASSKEDAIDDSDALVNSQEETHQYLSGFKLFAVMFCITLAGFLLLLDTSVVSTAIPKITGQFHSLNDVGWYGTAYLLANCALQPLTGKIYTYFSIKWTFLGFFALFELGSALCGAATSSNMLIIGRAVAGLGASGLLNGGYTIIHSIVPVDKEPLYRGILVGIAQLGMLSGPLVGGALTQYASWRWCFLINLPCGGAVAVLLLFISIPDYKGQRGNQTVIQRLGKLDLLGFFLFTPATIQFILALQWGGIKYDWNSATIIGLFCGSFGNLLVFLAWEYHMGDQAMIPFSLMRRRIMWTSCLNQACFVGVAFTATYYLPIYFQAVRNASPTMSGVDLLPLIIASMIFTIATGALVGRVGYYLPFAVVSGVFTAIGAGLTTTFTPTSSLGKRIGYLIIQGAGQGMGFQIPILAVQNSASQQESSIAAALVVFSQNLSGAIFLSLAQVIFSNQLRHTLVTYAPGVNPEVLVAAGASGSDVRSAVPAALLPGVLLAYSKAFDRTMYLAVGAACGAFVFAIGMGWVRLKKEAAEPKSDAKPMEP